VYRFIRTKLLFISLSLLLFACAVPQPAVQTGADSEVIDGNLHRVDNAAVTEAYVDPGFDIDNYEKILIEPLDVSRIALINPDYSRSDSNWQLNEKDRVYLAQRYRTSMIKNFFGLGGYTAALQPGQGVLRIQVALTQVGPSNSPGRTAGSIIMPARSSTSSGGAIGIVGIVEDSGTGNVVARFVDVRQCPSNWALSNELGNREEAKFLFESWARLFVFRMQENRKKKRETGKVW